LVDGEAGWGVGIENPLKEGIHLTHYLKPKPDGEDGFLLKMRCFCESLRERRHSPPTAIKQSILVVISMSNPHFFIPPRNCVLEMGFPQSRYSFSVFLNNMSGQEGFTRVGLLELITHQG
jgi:hypothetical protein